MTFFRRLSFLFSAGVLGGLMNAVAVGIYTQGLNPPLVYQRMVWGGLWGFIFLLPLKIKSLYVRGLCLSLGPTLVQWLIVFPGQGKGFFGSQLGTWTFLLVIVFNAVWGLAAAFWLKTIHAE